MATVDTRSGFRLPWSSDNSQHDVDQPDPTQDAQEGVTEPAAEPDAPVAVAWPTADRAADPDEAPAPPQSDEEPSMTPEVATPAPLPLVTRKPSRLMADLTAAILATTEAARDRALAAIEADATQVTEAIRTASMEGAEGIRRKAEEDLVSIKDWSKAEIARIREETETRTETRKATREAELTAHVAAVDSRVGEVQEAVARYRSEMDAYFGSLSSEDDPARLATMAEAMPDPPPLNALADLADLDIAAFAPVEAIEAEAEVAEPVEAEVVEAEAVEAAATDLVEAAGYEAPEPEIVTAEAVEADAATEPAAEAEKAGGWGTSDDAWDLPSPVAPAGDTAETAFDGIHGWSTGEAADNSLDVNERGNPDDRDAIMAALEAAAEAVVAAETTAGSADHAEGAAESDAESGADPLASRTDTDEQAVDAQAALAARVDAGGFDSQSFTDRLASLMPSPDEGAADAEPRTTRVIVTGLVSVASIASFKRHLSRLAGVKSVGVASGPDGEFVFNVSHRPDASFRDGIPSMPGFGARVTSTGDGFVQVTARDPESDG